MEAPTHEQIEACIEQAILHGGGNLLAANEQACGYTLISPGQYPWFSPEWPDDLVVSMDGPRVRIVAIYNPKQGNGAFSRLITGICKAGLLPTIIAPFGGMTELLKHWGWHHRVIGSTLEDRCDEWFPTRRWREQRTRDRVDNA